VLDFIQQITRHDDCKREDMTTESSVAVSLASLHALEDERSRDEKLTRTRVREMRTRETALAEARRVAELQAETERRAREEEEERARIEARERAAADVARIQAEARARLEIENAARAHELATLRVKHETGRRFREYGLFAILALVVAVGGVSTYQNGEHTQKLERTAEELKDRERSLTREKDEAKRVELAALDRRHESLVARPGAKQATEQKKTADDARAMLGSASLGHDRLRAFADALDSLETRIDAAEELGKLERRHADLEAWARAIGKKRAGATAVEMQKRARASLGSQALADYERALNDLADGLGDRVPPGTGPVATTDTRPSGKCNPDDPGCGLDGRPVF
jgi:hypothetical protein